MNNQNNTNRRSYIKCNSRVYASMIPRDALIELANDIHDYFEETGKPSSTIEEVRDYLESTGWSLEGITNDDIDEAWDLQSEWWGKDSSRSTTIDVKLSDGQTISSKDEAYEWLQSNINEYGNTYFWDSQLKADLNRLIEKFGNTYFWR